MPDLHPMFRRTARTTVKLPVLAALIATAACSPTDSGNEAGPLEASPTVVATQAPTATSSAPDPAPALRRALGGEGEARYVSARADLNGDGQDEVVAYLTGPYACGSGGCTLVVLTPEAGDYRTVTTASVVQLPVRLLPTSTRGWRDLAVGIGGGGQAAATAKLSFDGTRYPENPTTPPATPLADPSQGTVLIAADQERQPLP
jgi:hypothetical protein